MEVDPPTSSSSSSPVQNSSTLKRSNSAPMINMLVTSQTDISPASTLKPATCIALRRLSSSNMNLHGAPANTSPPIRGTDRVARIKQEEIHIADRERQHEREMQSSFWISNNWEHISLDASETIEEHRRSRSFSDSLHIMTQPSILCGSPSPTRAAVKQCFSPSMQIPVKSTAFTPSPSPSPTRKTFLRSLSPIAVRSGTLKRKLGENDGERYDYISPPKKFNTGPITPDRIITCSHPLASSRGQSPHSSNNNHGVDMVPSQMASKRAFLFRPVHDAVGSHPCTSSMSSSSMSLDHLQQHGQQHLEESSLSRGMTLHHSQPDHADMGSDSGNHTSSDIYMSDSEMRDHSDVVDKPSGGFSFKPISPDHG